MKTIGAEISVNPVFPKKSTSQDSHQQHPNNQTPTKDAPETTDFYSHTHRIVSSK